MRVCAADSERRCIGISRTDGEGLIRKSPTLTIAFRDRTVAFDVRCMLTGVVFPKPGTFVVEMYCNDQFVDDYTFRVVEE